MRTVKVVDASALASFCFDEPQITAIRRDLSDADLFAPAILDFEMANICWKRFRKWPDATEQTLRQFPGCTRGNGLTTGIARWHDYWMTAAAKLATVIQRHPRDRP